MKRLIGLITLVSFMFPQADINLGLESSILQPGLNRLSINDFDFIGAGKTKVLFRGTVTISGVTDGSTSVQMFFRMSYNGKNVINANTNTINGVANQTLTFTNLQISDDIRMNLFSGGTASLTFENLNLDKSFINPSNISSKLPDGKYVISVVPRIDGQIRNDRAKTLEFNLRQNWPINLMNPVGEVTTPTPLFQWDSRAATYPKVTLYVWENDGNKSSSINKSPILKKVYVNNADMGIQTSFAFPSDNDRPLEDGKKYFWTARVTITTAGGAKELQNEILEFTYKQPSDDNINQTAVESILKQLLGNAFSAYENEFAGFTLKSIKLNGDDARINNLATYIQKVTSGEYNLLVEIY